MGKFITDDPGSAAALKPGWSTTPHDALPLPGGGTVGKTPSLELRRRLQAAGVPGVTVEKGRGDIANAYAEHLAKIGAAASAAAVADWCAGKAGAP